MDDEQIRIYDINRGIDDEEIQYEWMDYGQIKIW